MLVLSWKLSFYRNMVNKFCFLELQLTSSCLQTKAGQPCGWLRERIKNSNFHPGFSRIYAWMLNQTMAGFVRHSIAKEADFLLPWILFEFWKIFQIYSSEILLKSYTKGYFSEIANKMLKNLLPVQSKPRNRNHIWNSWTMKFFCGVYQPWVLQYIWCEFVQFLWETWRLADAEV